MKINCVEHPEFECEIHDHFPADVIGIKEQLRLLFVPAIQHLIDKHNWKPLETAFEAANAQATYIVVDYADKLEKLRTAYGVRVIYESMQLMTSEK